MPLAPPSTGSQIAGMVKQVSGDTLTIETVAGSTVQVRLDTNGRITAQVAGTRADITVDAQVIILGEQNGTALTATRIEIIPAQAQ